MNRRLREYNEELRVINDMLAQQEQSVDRIIARARTASDEASLEYKRY